MSENIYPGWGVLAACFVCAMLMIGGTFYIFQLFVIPVTEEFGISRADMNLGYAALLIGMAIWSPFVGNWLDKFPAQRIFAFGGLAYGIGLFILSQTESLVLMCAVIGVLIALAMACAGGLAANTVTSKWFGRHRGLALGIAAVASSMGGFVLIPIVTALMERFEWRGALLVTGLSVSAVTIVISLIFIQSKPSDEIVTHHKEFKLPDTEAAVSEPSWRARDLYSRFKFWLLALGVGLLLASDQAILTSQVPYLRDLGFTSGQAAAVASAMTFSAIGGKLIVGYLADHVDQRHLFALVAIFHMALLGVFLMKPSFTMMLAFSSVFGAAVGGIYPVWSALTASRFGAKSFGLVFGCMAPITQILAIIFIRLIGESYDRTGDYDMAFYGFFVAVLIGMVLIYAMGRPGLINPKDKIQTAS